MSDNVTVAAVEKLRDLAHRLRGIRYAPFSQEIAAIADSLAAVRAPASEGEAVKVCECGHPLTRHHERGCVECECQHYRRGAMSAVNASDPRVVESMLSVALVVDREWRAKSKDGAEFWSDAANILHRAFDEDRIVEQFREWYDPAKWLHGYRALGAFIREKIAATHPAPAAVTEDAQLAIEDAMAERIIAKAGLDPNDCDDDSSDAADQIATGIRQMRERLEEAAAPATVTEARTEWEISHGKAKRSARVAFSEEERDRVVTYLRDQVGAHGIRVMERVVCPERLISERDVTAALGGAR